MGYKFRGTNFTIEEEVAALNGCGTYAGYRAHLRAGAATCRECKDAANTYWRERYELKKSEPPKPKGFRDDACGTNAGYARHLRYKLPSCPACRKAATQYIADWRAKKGAISDHEGSPPVRTV